MNVDNLPTWTERIAKAVASWKGEVSFSSDLMESLPLEIRMDRVFKDAGVRDLVVRVQELEEALRQINPTCHRPHSRADDRCGKCPGCIARAVDIEDMSENVVND